MPDTIPPILESVLANIGPQGTPLDEPRSSDQTVLDLYLRSRTFTGAREVIATHRVLLNEAADHDLGALIAAATERGDLATAVRLSQHHAFLRRCRRVGTDDIFPPGSEEIDPAALAAIRPAMTLADIAEAQFDETGDAAALTEAAMHWKVVLAHPALVDCYPDLRSVLLNNSGAVLLRRFRETGVRADLADALTALGTATAMTPPGSSQAAGRLGNLGLALLELHRLETVPKALSSAFIVLRAAVEAAQPVSRARVTALSNLALVLEERYAVGGDEIDLDDAVAACDDAVHIAAREGPSAALLSNLGNLLRRRYESGGREVDLARAVDAQEAAVRQTAAGDPERPRRLVNLAVALLDSHRRWGDARTLERARRLVEDAAATMPTGSPHYGTCVGQLGLVYYQRYESGGRLDDVDRAVALLEQATRTVPAHAVEWPIWQADLGAVLHERFRQTGHHSDLDRAIDVLRGARTTLGDRSPYLFACVNNLGNALRDRQAPLDLDEAIRMLEGALDGSAHPRAHHPIQMVNLAAALRDRHAAAGARRGDLDQAIAFAQGALAILPPDNVDVARALGCLALALADRYELSGNAGDLSLAVESYAQGCAKGLQSDPQSTLRMALHWAEWAAGRDAWAEAAMAYDNTLRALTRVVHDQLHREHKEVWLNDGVGLPQQAAYAAVRAERAASAAVALEMGRAVLLAEALDLHSADLEGLERDHAELAERYRRAAQRVQLLESQRLAPRAQPSARRAAARTGTQPPTTP